MKVLSIGRSSRDDIIINDPAVTRHHLQLIQYDDGSCAVVDCNSTNGTFVNGKRITGEVRLKPGDKVVIGRTQLPWEQYLKKQSSNSTRILSPGEEIPSGNESKGKKKWIIIAIILLLLGGICVGGYFFYANQKNQNEVLNEEIEKIKDDNAELESSLEKKNAEKKAAEEKARVNKNKADEAKKSAAAAQEEASLSNQFRKEMAHMSYDLADDVCRYFNIISDNPKHTLSHMFDDGDIAFKKRILSAIAIVRRQHYNREEVLIDSTLY